MNQPNTSFPVKCNDRYKETYIINHFLPRSSYRKYFNPKEHKWDKQHARASERRIRQAKRDMQNRLERLATIGA